MHSASDSLWFSFSMLFQITPETMSCVDKESLPDVLLIMLLTSASWTINLNINTPGLTQSSLIA